MGHLVRMQIPFPLWSMPLHEEARTLGIRVSLRHELEELWSYQDFLLTQTEHGPEPASHRLAPRSLGNPWRRVT